MSIGGARVLSFRVILHKGGVVVQNDHSTTNIVVSGSAVPFEKQDRLYFNRSIESTTGYRSAVRNQQLYI